MTDSSAKLTLHDGTSGAAFALEIKKPVRDAFTRLATRVHCWPRRRSNAPSDSLTMGKNFIPVWCVIAFLVIVAAVTV
jgi:hypothetical protein